MTKPLRLVIIILFLYYYRLLLSSLKAFEKFLWIIFETEGIQKPEALSTATWPEDVQELATLFGRAQAEVKSWPEELREMRGVYVATLSDSSTLPQNYSNNIDQKIELLFDRAKEEVFENGMESEFSRGLISCIRKYGNGAIAVLERLIVTEQVNAEVASEAMRWLGYIDHPVTYRSRLNLLERSLHNSSARVRDGAGLGLASLDDPHAIPYLKQAIEREKYHELRHDLEQVLSQLESTRSASSAENNSKTQMVQ